MLLHLSSRSTRCLMRASQALSVSCIIAQDQTWMHRPRVDTLGVLQLV